MGNLNFVKLAAALPYLFISSRWNTEYYLILGQVRNSWCCRNWFQFVELGRGPNGGSAGAYLRYSVHAMQPTAKGAIKLAGPLWSDIQK